MNTIKIKFSDLAELNAQLHNFNEKTPCWYAFSRTKIRTKKAVDSILEKHQLDRDAIIERFGVKGEDGNWLSKKQTNESGQEIDVYDFGVNDKEANELLANLWKEVVEQEVEVEIFKPSSEDASKMLSMDLSSARVEMIAEYLLS